MLCILTPRLEIAAEGMQNQHTLLLGCRIALHGRKGLHRGEYQERHDPPSRARRLYSACPSSSVSLDAHCQRATACILQRPAFVVFRYAPDHCTELKFRIVFPNAADVRSGSSASVLRYSSQVCFYPNSGAIADTVALRLWATTRPPLEAQVQLSPCGPLLCVFSFPAQWKRRTAEGMQRSI